MPLLKDIQALAGLNLLVPESIDGIEVRSLAKHPTDAEDVDDLALVFSDKYRKVIETLEKTKSRIVVIAESVSTEAKIQDFIKQNQDFVILTATRVRFALVALNRFFNKRNLALFDKSKQPLISMQSYVSDGANLADNVRVGRFSSIEVNVSIGSNTVIADRVSIEANVIIGQNCVIYPGVVIYDGVIIGDNVIIHANTVIGGDGFSYVTEHSSNVEKLQKQDFNLNLGRQIQHKIDSIGSVLIEDNVEIGSNTTIDRGTIGNTIIGEGTKIDNLCQIAHNVQIGKDCVIISGTGIAGSAILEDRVLMAGASGCGDGVKISNDVIVGAFSAVNSDADPFLPLLGAPALPYGEFMNRQRAMIRMPKVVQEFRELKRQIEKSGILAEDAQA